MIYLVCEISHNEINSSVGYPTLTKAIKEVKSILQEQGKWNKTVEKTVTENWFYESEQSSIQILEI